jgi:hypothetical protein
LVARHGRTAAFYLNSVALTSFLDTLELPFDVETADTTTFGNNWKASIPGLIGATISGSGSYDPTNTTGPSSAILAVIAGGAAVTFAHFPGGSVSGQRTNTGSCIVTNFTESSAVGDKVAFSFEAQVTGTVTSGTVS